MLSWEQSVEWLRSSVEPQHKALVKACYFDDPLDEALNRYFNSLEWSLLSNMLPDSKGVALDVGAGRGICSYALAKSGWAVFSLEPDPSTLVGSGAINFIKNEFSLDISVLPDYSESVSLPDSSLDLVFCRQALHHSNNLFDALTEFYRLLKPGGFLIAAREHVISSPQDLQQFLDRHPLHYLYGGENAYTLKTYKSAFLNAGFKSLKLFPPYSTPINYFPTEESTINEALLLPFQKILGKRLPRKLFLSSNPLSSRLNTLLRSVANQFIHTPGRLYTFTAVKPFAQS
ncbi:class I SAM-dependent methyltransferase [Synechococcus sp. Cu2B8-bc1011]|uniref:class I SAM-dependent methyltransferase n=1 Tax=Synechococcus sp. Cu2B8-bc1011 TaxID=3093725 RepID=UPI0039AFF8CC